MSAACRTWTSNVQVMSRDDVYAVCVCEIDRRDWKLNVFYDVVMVRVRVVMVRVSG